MSDEPQDHRSIEAADLARGQSPRVTKAYACSCMVKSNLCVHYRAGHCTDRHSFTPTKPRLTVVAGGKPRLTIVTGGKPPGGGKP